MTRKPYSYSERLAMETMLNEGYSIIDISKDIKRKSSGIIKEINKHTQLKFPSYYNGQHPCLKYHTCEVRTLECYLFCKSIETKVCPKLAKSPHVCNGCITKGGCRYIKRYYFAREAHDIYKELLSNSRTGLHYTENEILILIERLCPLIVKSKSVYHSVITINNIFETKFNIKSIYRQIKGNYLPISSADLPRCRRICKEKIDRNYKRDITNHTYDDFKQYKDNNPNAVETQMDTVEGIKENNAPVLLTLEIVEINFLFIFKIDSQTVNAVTKKLIYLKDILGDDLFNKIMEILLTDNGKEFINIEQIKLVSSNINIFYCHPYSSFEKGSIENAHELIRRVIPKGVSLKPYTQKELNLLCSHINNLYRESLDGKCPFELIDKYIPLDVINKLGLTKINPLDVCLIPELLGNKNVENIKKYLDKNDIKKANIKLINND